MEVAEMADKMKKWSTDWHTFDWKAVDRELQEKGADSEEITTMTKEMFTEYLEWLKETQPELLEIIGVMYQLKEEGTPENELNELKNLWDDLTGAGK
jgi:hypothetical protein